MVIIHQALIQINLSTVIKLNLSYNIIIMTTIINSANKKFAVVIGINYVGTSNALNGCINDAKNVKAFLIDKAGYLAQNIVMIADDGINPKPTKQNILNSFTTLINKATNEGFNELWFSYSGHGSYQSDKDGDEDDRNDEVICPSDFSSAGMIVDDYIYDNFVCKLPANTTLFSIMDCCHSGTIFDLPCLYNTTYTTNNTKNKHVAKVISISGCKDNQTSADAYINNGYEGAMTWSFLNALFNAKYNIKLVDLVNKMRVLLKSEYTQVPLLAVSNSSLYDSTFIGLTTPSAPTPSPTPSTPTPTPPSKQISFKLTVDQWYKESSWNIFSVKENKYIFTAFKTFATKNQITQTTVMLAPGTYKLCVNDTYGDGGVTSLVKSGILTLVSAKMISGKSAEYTFIV